MRPLLLSKRLVPRNAHQPIRWRIELLPAIAVRAAYHYHDSLVTVAQRALIEK